MVHLAAVLISSVRLLLQNVQHQSVLFGRVLKDADSSLKINGKGLLVLDIAKLFLLVILLDKSGVLIVHLDCEIGPALDVTSLLYFVEWFHFLFRQREELRLEVVVLNLDATVHYPVEERLVETVQFLSFREPHRVQSVVLFRLHEQQSVALLQVVDARVFGRGLEVVDWPRVFDQKSVIRDVQSVLRHEHVDILSDVEVLQLQTHVKLKPNWKRLILTF